MAIGNFIKANTYSKLSNVLYEKNVVVEFNLNVFYNDQLLTSIRYRIQPVDINVFRKVAGFTTDNNIPVHATYVDLATKEFVLNIEGTIQRTSINQKFYIGDKFYSESGNQLDELTMEQWQNYFSIEKVSEAGNNQYKAIYDYLMTLPEFSNCAQL